MKIIKRISPGQMLPPFYGFAWRDWCTDAAICLPVPLNLFASIAHAIWLFMKHGGRSVPANPRDAYDQGYRDAYDEMSRCKNMEWRKDS